MRMISSVIAVVVVKNIKMVKWPSPLSSAGVGLVGFPLVRRRRHSRTQARPNSRDWCGGELWRLG